MKPISVQVDEIMTGLNPKADARLAADLGVKIKPEEQDEVPPVVLGNAGYETDASGKAVEIKTETDFTLKPRKGIEVGVTREKSGDYTLVVRDGPHSDYVLDLKPDVLRAIVKCIEAALQ